MSEGSADAAAVEVDDLFAFSQRKDDALIESVGAVRVEQSGLPQQIEGKTLCSEMTAENPAGSVTDLKVPDQAGIMQPALVEIEHRFGVLNELLLIESRSLFEHVDGAALWSGLHVQAREALAERQPVGQLHKANQIAAPAAAVAVENVLVRVDIERGPGLLVQWTESDDLGSARRMTSPVMLPQIVQKRHPPLECYDVFAHGAFFASGAQRRSRRPAVQGKDGG